MVLLPPESIDYDFNIADYQQVRASSSSYLQIISSSYWAARIQSFYFNLFKKIYLLITVVLSLLYVLKKKKVALLPVLFSRIILLVIRDS